MGLSRLEEEHRWSRWPRPALVAVPFAVIAVVTVVDLLAPPDGGAPARAAAPSGRVRGAGLDVEMFPFEIGDTVLLYTDGVIEARDKAGVFHPLAERPPPCRARVPAPS